MATLTRREFNAMLAAAPFLSLARGAVAPAINPPGEGFIAALPGLMQLSGVPGLSMAVVHGGAVAWTHYSGVMDVEKNRGVTSRTLFPAASLSKPVFAYAALRLVDQGELDLDRPLKRYVPDHAPADARGDLITA